MNDTLCIVTGTSRGIGLATARALVEVGADVIGVGGAASAKDVLQYLDAGASAVHIATAAMVDPLVGIAIRRELADRANILPRV